MVTIQVDLVTELEERLPSVRLYFFKRFHVLTKLYSSFSQIIFQRTFDNKVKAVKSSEVTYSNVIEEYQVNKYISIIATSC